MNSEDLLDRHTGDWLATYQSRRGKEWLTVRHEFDEYLSDCLYADAGQCPEGIDFGTWDDLVKETIAAVCVDMVFEEVDEWIKEQLQPKQRELFNG